MLKILIHLLLGTAIFYAILQEAQQLQAQEKRMKAAWETVFNGVYTIRKNTFEKNSAFKSEFNQSRFNVIESPNYCKQSDALKMVHPDLILEDRYVWRDYPVSNLPKRITMEKSFSLLPFVLTSKTAGFKHENKLPLELTYIYTTVSTLFNNYHWGRGMGCALQKYSHIPGKGSMSQKNQLIDNFMQYTRKFSFDSDCKRNASFIPETYRLNDLQDCKDFFATFNTTEYKQKFKKYGPQYIMKTNAHRGEGITVLFEKEEQELLQEYDYGKKCGKIQKQIIGQRYISNPFLYKGHKIEFRIYFIIASTNPMIAYSYQKALIKRCASPFSVHSTERSAHVCNTAIVKNLIGKDKDPDEVEDEEFFIDWYLEGIEDLLIKAGRAKKGWLENYLYPKIHRSLIHMMRATYHSYGRDSTFGEFFAVDFLLDDDLDVWVLEVNYNPMVLSVTPDRIRRNYKMIEDQFEVYFNYVKSKWKRLRKFMKKFEQSNKNVTHYQTEILNILEDRLEPEFQISSDNLYVKIMDEGLPFPYNYNNLIQKQCNV